MRIYRRSRPRYGTNACEMSRTRRKADPRVLRTRAALGDALIALMEEREFEKITVQDVLDRAGVGRSTFYVHYHGKDDLFMSDVDEFWSSVADGLLRAKERSHRVVPVRELFAHAAGMTEFVQALHKSGRAHEVMELGRMHMARAIAKRIATQRHGLSQAQLEAFAHAQAGALIGLFEWWLAHEDSMTPDEADEMFHRTLWNALDLRGERPSRPQ